MYLRIAALASSRAMSCGSIVLGECTVQLGERMSCEQGVQRGQQLGYGEVGSDSTVFNGWGSLGTLPELTSDSPGWPLVHQAPAGWDIWSAQDQHKQKLNRSPHSCPAKRGWSLDVARQIRKHNKTQIAATAVTRQPHKHRIR